MFPLEMNAKKNKVKEWLLQWSAAFVFPLFGHSFVQISPDGIHEIQRVDIMFIQLAAAKSHIFLHFEKC